MSTTIKIHLTEEAKKIVANFKTLPDRALTAIAAAMNQENQLTVSHIQRKNLSFPGAGPTTPLGLRYRSGRYRDSLNSPAPVIEGQKIVSGIGSNVNVNGFSYPKLHEFGGRVKVKGREHKVRLRTDARGALVRQLKNSNLARFAKKDGKRFTERTSRSQDHTAFYPARAPIQKGIQDNFTNYKKAISAAIVGAMKGPAT